MGYESRIYVVEKTTLPPDFHGKRYARLIAMFNACVYPGLREVFRENTDCYVFSDGGNTEIIEDCYGKELTEAALSDVIKFLENEVQRGETYRRIKPLLGLLKSFDESQWKNLVCLHYGY